MHSHEHTQHAEQLIFSSPPRGWPKHSNEQGGRKEKEKKKTKKIKSKRTNEQDRPPIQKTNIDTHMHSHEHTQHAEQLIFSAQPRGWPIHSNEQGGRKEKNKK